jgi:hypothetical protein
MCNKCGFFFSRKSSLNYHTTNNVCGKSDFKCADCGYIYSNKTALNRHFESKKHLSTHSVRHTNINDSNHTNISIGNNNHINNITVNQTQVKNVFLILDYRDSKLIDTIKGHEAYAILTKDDFIGSLTQQIHFDKNKPSGNNVICENIKDKRAVVYSKGKWQTKDLKLVAQELFDDRARDIKTIFDRHKLSLSEEKIEQINLVLDKAIRVPYNVSKFKNNDEHNEFLAEQDAYKKKTVKRLIYLILDGTKDLHLKRNAHMDKK